MTTKINNEHNKLNVPNLRFPEFQGEWEEHKLEDITAEIGDGIHATPIYDDNGTFYFVNGNNISEYGITITATTQKVTEEEALRNNASALNSYSILLSINGTVGNVALYKNESIMLGKSACYINVSSNINRNYIFYYLMMPKCQFYFTSELTGTTIKNLSLKSIRKTKVLLPNANEQSKIARLFDAINERIATQNKIIEDLKKLKSAIIEIEYTPNTKTTSPIGDVIEQISKRNKNNAIQNVLSVSNRQGFIKQSDQFENRNVASEDTSNYKIVEHNDFAFNPARINVGSIARLTTFEKGIVSPMYICFRTQENVAPEYIDYFFESKHFYCEIQKRLEGSVRQCLSFEGLCNIPLSLPSFEMQQLIGKRLFTLGQKIKTEIDLLELLNKQKQYLLRQMFI